MHRIVEEGRDPEQFRTLHRREARCPGADRLHAFARAFEFVETEGEAEKTSTSSARYDRQEGMMREFWVSSGHHLTRRTEGGGLAVTDELLLAYLARPELVPPGEACDAERDLHARLLREPRDPVPPHESNASPTRMRGRTGRDDGSFATGSSRRRSRRGGLSRPRAATAPRVPPLFLNQLVHLILRNALDGCEDPYVLRAAELFFRAAAGLDARRACFFSPMRRSSMRGGARASPLVAMLGKDAAPSELDVLDDEMPGPIGAAPTPSRWR